MAGVLLIPAAVASWLLAGRALSPLRAMRTTAREISESDLTGRIVPAHPDGSPLRDELDDLATTFNDMLDRLEASFRAQRQFVDDAGHELRTPLTIVKGHLELLDDDPAARVETLALVDDELDRMGQLVADLQTLTKSTQPAFLNFGPVDLGQLVEEVTARARPLADRRWADEGGPAHEILADRHRLVQALLQLVDNAVTHTDPGARIAVGARADDDQVTLWVTDTGPGVPAELRDHLFDRFVHDSDRSGSGLGLSIVAAIARAHGGYAALLDPGPGGTRFGLVLPMRRPDVTPEEP
ncbi:MAG: HAMP domain-containing sensor histidine kinase [Candidatus Nanopelagicales bacterium]